MQVDVATLLPEPLRAALSDGRLAETSVPRWLRRYQQEPERVGVELAQLAAGWPGLGAAKDAAAEAVIASEVVEALTGRQVTHMQPAGPVSSSARPNVAFHSDAEIEAAVQALSAPRRVGE